MMSHKEVFAGPLEIKVIRLLEEHGSLSVSQTQELLQKSGEDLAYTTIMTVMSRLYNKGFLNRDKSGRQFFYQVSQGKRSLFSKLKKTFFGTDRLKPILSLLDSDSELSLEELKTLRSAINARIKEEQR